MFRSALIPHADCEDCATLSAKARALSPTKNESGYELEPRLAQLLGITGASLSQGKLSYELRRLRQRGLIERLPKTHRYHVTSFGLRAAVFYSRLHAHLFRPAMATVMPAHTPDNSRVRAAFNALDQLLGDQARSLAA